MRVNDRKNRRQDMIDCCCGNADNNTFRGVEAGMHRIFEFPVPVGNSHRQISCTSDPDHSSPTNSIPFTFNALSSTSGCFLTSSLTQTQQEADGWKLKTQAGNCHIYFCCVFYQVNTLCPEFNIVNNLNFSAITFYGCFSTLTLVSMCQSSAAK